MPASLSISTATLPWHRRHVLHKIGVMMLGLATLIFIAGFAIPAWTAHSGLWMTCFSGTTTCKANVFSLSNVWINVVRVAECMAFFSFVLSMIVAILQDFYLRRNPSPCNKLVEAMAITAGICGITGVIIFGIRWSSSRENVLEVLHKNKAIAEEETHLNWGFGLVTAASILSLLSALAIGCGRCRYAQAPRGSHRTSKNQVPGLGRPFEEEISFRTNNDGSAHDVDTSSMMLVPAGHFDSKRASSSPRPRSKGRGKGCDPPPPYALPPPYPYSSNTEFFLPIANSSMMPQGHRVSSGHRTGSSVGGDSSSQVTDQSLAFHTSADAGFIARSTDTGFIATRTSGQSFREMGASSPIPSYSYDSTHFGRPAMRPMFIKAAEGGSVEITPSAQNSMALPSPFKHF